MTRLLSVCCLGLLLCAAGAAAQDIFDAARTGDLAAVKALVAADSALVSARNAAAKTALTFAAQGGHAEVVAWLLGAGADVNTRNVRDETPLLYAAWFGHVEVVECLLAHGADPNISNGDGENALDVAVMNGNYRIIRLLEAAGAAETPVPAPEVVRVTGGMHTIAFRYGGTPNILAYAGRDGWLLVDTGWQRTVPDLLKTLQSLDDRGIIAIINTHQHTDHCDGNVLATRSTRILSSARLDELVADGAIRPGAGPLSGRTGRSFDRYYAYDFGGEEIRLIPAGGAHTDGDLLVHFTRSNVVDMGDLLILQSFPSVTEAVDEYLEILARTCDVFPEDATFVCGHGKGGTARDVADYRRMLIGLRDLVGNWIGEGRSREDILQDPALAEFAAFGTFIPELRVEYWVEAVWRSRQRPG